MRVRQRWRATTSARWREGSGANLWAAIVWSFWVCLKAIGAFWLCFRVLLAFWEVCRRVWNPKTPPGSALAELLHPAVRRSGCARDHSGGCSSTLKLSRSSTMSATSGLDKVDRSPFCLVSI